MKPHSPLLLTVTLTIATLGTGALTGCMGLAQTGAISRAYGSYEKGKYSTALARLHEAESYGEVTPARRAEILYLKARCLEGLGSTAEAVELYHLIGRSYPDSEFGARAKGRLEEMRSTPVPTASPAPKPATAPF